MRDAIIYVTAPVTTLIYNLGWTDGLFAHPTDYVSDAAILIMLALPIAVRYMYHKRCKRNRNMELWIETVKQSNERDAELIIKATVAQLQADFDMEKATKLITRLTTKKPTGLF